jgi:hypothetical protein
MDGTGEYAVTSLDLDALAVSDRFRLFNFTRRDDHIAYLWVLRAVVTVHVIDDEGRKPVAQFATRIAERAADQGVLLEDRERKVLEDELLAALAQQIHGRVLAARDLTRDMNADTRSKPMSSGIAVPRSLVSTSSK